MHIIIVNGESDEYTKYTLPAAIGKITNHITYGYPATGYYSTSSTDPDYPVVSVAYNSNNFYVDYIANDDLNIAIVEVGYLKDVVTSIYGA